MTPQHTTAAVDELLAAIESRDMRAVARSLSPDATWQNVPHAVVAGRDSVVAMLARIVGWSDEVRWEVHSSSVHEHAAHLERIDRFHIDGSWYEVACHGIFSVDANGRVDSVRDYVDLGEWRARTAPVMARMAERPAAIVVARHLAAVRTGNVAAMAADYGFDAVLTRPTGTHMGWYAIADYFDTVAGRLDGRSVEFHETITTAPSTVAVRWSIGELDGTDIFEVADGSIIRQTVRLDAGDF